MARLNLSRHDWLSLVDQSGLLISEPVLLSNFPDGPEKVEPWLHRKFQRQFQRRFLGADPAARQKAWLDFVLDELLGLGDRLGGNDVPQGCAVYLVEYDQRLRASWVLVDHEHHPIFLGLTVPPDQELERRETRTGRWKATPVTKMERLLQDAGVSLGLLTNGDDFRLIHAPQGLSPSAITFSAQTFADEKSTLDAFFTLLRAERFTGGEKTRLLTLVRESQDRQVDVADQLGDQVRDALAVFVRALDDSDRASGGALLADVSDETAYEMSLVVMMRLVFLLYAEENRLLPHGETLYDLGYGLTHLWTELEDDLRAERLDHAADSWPRFLSTCRLVYEGCDHPDLRLLAYGGRLFDTDRFPVLEDSRFTVSNRTMYEMLRQLLFAWGKIGSERMRQRVSYRTLDVEQIGYVYEGLLDHRIGSNGDSALLRLIGDKEPEIALDELIGKPRKEQVKALATAMGLKAEKHEWIEKKLDEAAEQERPRNLPENLDPSVAAAARPFDTLLRRGGAVEPRHRYVTLGTSRRISGSHYTPQTLTSGIVRTTLEPVVYRNDQGVYELVGGRKVLVSPRELLDLKVCDMAMGSGAFLVQAVRYLADRLVETWEVARQTLPDGAVLALPFAEPVKDTQLDRVIPDDIDEQRVWARRYVAEKCIYGVDKNRLAVEMAKLSLWLTTLAKDRAFTFLDHALKWGDSLLGVNRDQLEAWSFHPEEKYKTRPIFTQVIRQAVDEAIALRRKLAEAPAETTRQQRDKAKLLSEADRAMRVVKLGGDLLVASHFGAEKPKEREKLQGKLLDEFSVVLTAYQEKQRTKLKDEIVDDVRSEAARRADSLLDEERPFHWPFEFPEVFLDIGLDQNPRKGFDAIVGNPPFAGGRKMRGNYGDRYVEWLLVQRQGASLNADLCAFFYLRAHELLDYADNFGLIATNTIAQGDTKETGLIKLVGGGASIIAAISGMPWPGKAGVHVSVVHMHDGAWKGERHLDGKPVSYISPLLDASRSWQTPERLKQNAGKSFIGSFVNGMGFILEPEEAEALLARNHHNRQVLFPYLNGEDLNTDPEQRPSRWAIDFRDRPLDMCEKRWPEILEIVRERVKPIRDEVNREAHRRFWWHHGDKRPALYAAIEGMERVLVMGRVVKYPIALWVPKDWVYNEKTVVFVDCPLEIINSTIHFVWAWRYSSTMRDAGINYSPSDCLDTFPFPQDVPEQRKAILNRIGETYHEHRRQVMKNRWIGLTKTYNLFHNPACEEADITKLRALHVEMDNGVLAAYAWQDIDLGHDFREATWLPGSDRLRYTITPEAREQIIERLLDLNRQIAEQEAKGEAPTAAKKASGKRGRKSKVPDENLELF